MGEASAIISLGLAVVKLIIKLTANENTVKISDGVINIVEKGASVLENRKGRRTLETISDNISEMCKTILEQADISNSRAEAIAEDIMSVLNSIEMSEDHIICDIRAKPSLLKKELQQKSEATISLYDEKEKELCSRLFDYITDVTIEAYLTTNKAAIKGTLAIFEQLDELMQSVSSTLKKVNDIEKAVLAKSPDAKRYETLYRSNIIAKYENINLLGAMSLTRDETKYPLDIGYVSLELIDENLTSPISLQSVVKKYKTVWISGEAGSGKSTLLQWLAVNCARNTSGIFGDENDCLPIFIELRTVNADAPSLNKAINRIVSDEGYNAPEGWLHSLLQKGNAILLFDGVDEVKKEDRTKILDWIETVQRKYSKVRIVITSRPQVSERIYANRAELSILPMQPSKIDEFINYWHKAVLEEKLHLEAKEIDAYKEKLQLCLTQNEAVRRIARNPLLCAMICALHYKNGTILSTNRIALYEDCCKMLLSTRDAARNLTLYSHILLNYEEKKAILSRFAYWILRNGAENATIESLKKIIADVLRSLDRSHREIPVDEICKYFIERSGLLQIVENSQVDFIHRSFLEYLAASEIVLQEDWGFLLKNADDESWLETLVLSIGLASNKQAENSLKKILQREETRFTIIAAICAGNRISLNEKLRDRINNGLSTVLPPKTIVDCVELAKVGNAITQLLLYNPQFTVREQTMCLNTLYRIISPQSLRVSFTYLTPNLPLETLKILGETISYYTRKEIEESGIITNILDYIRQNARTGRLVIPESFLYYLYKQEYRKIKQALSKVVQLTLIDFENQIDNEIYKYFSGVKAINICGSFDEINAINVLGEQLQSAVVCDYSGEFNFYSLNHTKFQPTAFRVHTGREMYFSGKDLHFLKKASTVGLYLYNDMSEVYFDEETDLEAMNNFELFLPHMDMDLGKFLSVYNKAVITVYAPSQFDIAGIIQDIPFEGRNGRIHIELFKYPFGDFEATTADDELMIDENT